MTLHGHRGWPKQFACQHRRKRRPRPRSGLWPRSTSRRGVRLLRHPRGGLTRGTRNVTLRLYDGPYPVVAHPPCSRWGQLANVNQRPLWDGQIGDDGGCFPGLRLRAAGRWGGVLGSIRRTRSRGVTSRLPPRGAESGRRLARRSVWRLRDRGCPRESYLRAWGRGSGRGLLRGRYRLGRRWTGPERPGEYVVGAGINTGVQQGQAGCRITSKRSETPLRWLP